MLNVDSVGNSNRLAETFRRYYTLGVVTTTANLRTLVDSNKSVRKFHWELMLQIGVYSSLGDVVPSTY